MENINTVVISGNLTRDAELRYTNSGKAVMSFTVAVNDRCKNQQTGQWEDAPNFIECVSFAGFNEAIAKYMVKGLKVAVSGKLRWSKWEKDGETRSKIQVIVDKIEKEYRHQQEDYYEDDLPWE